MGIFPNSPFVIAFFTAVFLRRIFVYYEFFAAGGAEPCFITCSAWGVASLIPPWLCALSAAEKSRACFSLVNYSFATFLADRVLFRCGFSFFFNSGTRSFYSCCRYFENFGYFCVTDTTVVQEHYNFQLILSHQTTSTVMYCSEKQKSQEYSLHWLYLNTIFKFDYKVMLWSHFHSENKLYSETKLQKKWNDFWL